MFIDGPRYTDASPFGETLHTGGNVDPIAVDSSPLLNDIAKVNTDPKFHPAVVRKISVSGFEFSLNFNRSLDCIDHTRKLSQDVVAGRIYHSTAMLLYEHRHHFSVGFQSLNGSHFVFSHETTIAFNVRTEDGGQLTANAF